MVTSSRHSSFRLPVVRCGSTLGPGETGPSSCCSGPSFLLMLFPDGTGLRAIGWGVGTRPPRIFGLEPHLPVFVVRAYVRIYRQCRSTGNYTSGSASTVLCFRCRSMSRIVDIDFIELGNPENIGLAVRIQSLSSAQREIHGLKCDRTVRNAVATSQDFCKWRSVSSETPSEVAERSQISKYLDRF
jgi:hypothetical protein